MSKRRERLAAEMATPILRGPYEHKNAQMTTLLLPAESLALMDLCDRLLNDPIPGKRLRYEPLMPAIFLTLTTMETSPLHKMDGQSGRVQETTVSCRILIQALKRHQTVYRFDHLAWFVPYAFVDEHYSLVGAREMYSLREVLAQFEVKNNEMENPEYSVDVLAFPRFSPNTYASLQPLLQVAQTKGGKGGQPIQDWSSWPEAIMGIFEKVIQGDEGAKMQKALDVAHNPLGALTKRTQPIVFHKWFGRELQAQATDYLWVGEAPFTVRNFVGGRLLPDGYEVTVNPLDSHPIAPMLGLSDGVQPVLAGWQFELDFEVGKSQNMYELPLRERLHRLPKRDRGFGFPVLRGPYRHDNAQIAVFALNADEDALNTLCDSLNLDEDMPAGQQIRPLPFVFLRFSQANLRSLDAKDSQLGYLPEVNISFWLLMQVLKADKNGDYKHDHLTWFVPYSFLDNQYSLIADREIFSLQDLLAEFDLTEFTPQNPQYGVDVLGFDEFDEHNHAKKYRLIEIKKAVSKSEKQKISEDAVLWSDWNEAAKAIAQVVAPQLSNDSLTPEDISSFWQAEQSIIFLKPYYNMNEPERIFYRGLGKAPMQIPAFHCGNLQPDKSYRITLHSLASHPMMQTLGLPEGEQRVMAGWWLNLDLDILTGEPIGQSEPRPQKVAVLGGGIAALTTVFELTNQRNWQELYDITVYQMGWRLGGKLASGRNAAMSSRIEEETMMHAFYGFYDNAFRMVRHIYGEINTIRDKGEWDTEFIFDEWDDAFNQKDFFIVMDKIKEHWEPWQVNLPPNIFTPGDVGQQADLWAYFTQILGLVKANTPAFLQEIESVLFQNAPTIAPLLHRADKFLDRWGIDLLGGRTLTDLEALMESAHAQANGMSNNVNNHFSHEYDAINKSLSHFLQTLSRFESFIPEPTTSLRRLWLLFELAIINLLGVLEDKVLLYGFDTINDLDYREWLQKHGATNKVLASAPVRALYTIFEAYPGGYTSADDQAVAGDFAAGTALHVSLLMAFAYKGSAVWLPKTCMGEIVVSPLYQLLKKRGVKFEFFHKVMRIEPASDGTIGRIRLNQQATVKAEIGKYDPLLLCKGLQVWPNQPDFEQLEQGQILKNREINLESFWSSWPGVGNVTLERDEDFDIVLLGISLGALEHICPPLLDRNQNPQSWLKWRNMFKHVATLQTQGIKLWFEPPLGSLGWPLASPASGAYVNPLNSSLDMTHTVPFEDWPPLFSPQTVISFVGPLPESLNQPAHADPGYPKHVAKQARQTALAWIEEYVHAYCPYFVNPLGQLNYDKLADLQDGTGQQRFDAQYWAANINPSNRAVLSVKGSEKYRMKVDGTGFSNLYVVGDWIDNGYLNIGCVEAAVIAGIQGSRAISGMGQPILTVLPKISIG